MMTDPAHPRVSVAIPVYNSASTLERCIRSAMRQTLADIEILVADDGSTDDSATVADRLAQEDSRIRVLRIVPNGGKPAAMNRLIAEARGEWVAVLDADDAYHDARLEHLVAAATARKWPPTTSSMSMAAPTRLCGWRLRRPSQHASSLRRTFCGILTRTASSISASSSQ
jgi:glycosyltransferase involved in cell wall biosynthesis